jgi:enamine deaminase RidA (YjgF/YER057c/UK114 family)
MNFKSLPFVLILGLLGCQQEKGTQKSDIEFFTSPEMEHLNLPFSEAVRIDNEITVVALGNLSGQAKLVEGGIEEETRQTFKNMARVLNHFGVDLSDVVKCKVMLSDISEWSKMNEVYRTFFTKPFPFRSTIAGSGLALGAKIECECIAIIDH